MISLDDIVAFEQGGNKGVRIENTLSDAKIGLICQWSNGGHI